MQGGGGGAANFLVLQLGTLDIIQTFFLQFMTMCKCVTHFDIAQGELGWIEHPFFFFFFFFYV